MNTNLGLALAAYKRTFRARHPNPWMFWRLLMAGEADFTVDEKLRCIEREIHQRQRVYPRLVAGQRMTTEKADREIAIMEAIAADYRKRAAQERLL